MKKTLVQKLGLLGIVSFLSYASAVVFAPLAYPGYDRMAQAVSDLSAANAPSLALWNQLSALYNVCEVVCATVVCIGIRGAENKAAARGDLSFCRHGVDLGSRLPYVPALRQRLCRRVSGRYAHGRYGFGGAAVYRVADRYHHRGGKKGGQRLPVIRHLRRRCALHDARRRDGDEDSSGCIFRCGRALQRVCGNGIQRGARNPPLYLENK